MRVPIYTDDVGIKSQLKDLNFVKEKVQNIFNMVGELRDLTKEIIKGKPEQTFAPDMKYVAIILKDRFRLRNELKESVSYSLVCDYLNELNDELLRFRNITLDSFTVSNGVVAVKDLEKITRANTFYVENEKQKQYFDKVNAFISARNSLESFLLAQAQPCIDSNETVKSGDRFLYSPIGNAINHCFIAPNWRAIAEL